VPQRIRAKLTYANLVSSLCLFLLLGSGVAYAAGHLAKNSVGTRQLKNDSVTAAKIEDGAVTGAKVKDGSLGAADLAPGTIPAGAAGTAGPAGPASAQGPPGEPGAGLTPASFIDAGLPDGEPGCGAHQGFVNWEPQTTEHVGYYRSPDGLVHLKGSGLQCLPDNGVVFVLPPGYRPLENVYFLSQDPSTREPIVVDISSDGEVFSGLGNAELPISLDGISFRCGPVGGAGCP
jgi:hypothetical protein